MCVLVVRLKFITLSPGGASMANSRWLRFWKSFLSDGRSKKILVVLTIALIGTVMAFAINGIVGKNVEQHHSEGIVIDYGNYNTVWTRVNLTEKSADPIKLLEIACEKNHATPTFKNEKLVGIKTGDKTVSNDSDHEWGLWYVKKGKCNFEKSDTYEINVSDYTVVSWAYTKNGEEPTVAVDASGKSIYGYSKPNDVVALSKACKYMVAPMGKYNVKEMPGDCSPVLEKECDIVICDGSIPTQYEVADNLRNLGVDCVVIYNSKTLKDVVNNIFITGTAVGYDALDIAMKNVNNTLDELKKKTSTMRGYSALITLGPDSSAWVAGQGTYANEIISFVNGYDSLNAIKGRGKVPTPVNGWVKLSDYDIHKMNPDCIIILDPNPLAEYNGKYGKYEDMKAVMTDMWKNTSAGQNDRIYLFTGDLGMKAQCPGPGTLEFAITLSKIINPDAYNGPGSVSSLPIEIDDTDYITEFMGDKLIGGKLIP